MKPYKQLTLVWLLTFYERMIFMKSRQGLKAVLYARFSSDQQRSESIDAQVRAMTKYCEHNHMIIIDTYIDEAKSATSDKRPSFLKMIEDSKQHIFDVVLVHKLDRFSRNRYDSAMYKRTLKQNGVRVLSVLENLDDTPESIMLESLLEGMSEYYSKNLAREVMKGLNENALKCKHNGGKAPLGYYVNEDKRLSINEKEAMAVRLIFDRYSKGHTYDEIIKELNENNYLTKKGNIFAKNSLYNILTNEKYSGVYVYNKSSSKDMFNKRNTHLYKADDDIIRINGGCPQIVDKETFDIVQSRIADNKRNAGQYSTKHKYILSGLVFCSYCGRRMTGNRRYSGRNKSLYVTYRCPTHSSICDSKEINRYYLEDFVLSKIREFFMYKEQVSRIYRRINKYIKKCNSTLEDDLQKLNAEIFSITEKLSNITNAIEKGAYTDDIFTRCDFLQQRKNELETEISKKKQISQTVFTDDDIDNTITNCKKLLKNPVNPENKSFIKLALKRIDITNETVKITLNTGLSVNDQYDTVITASRAEIYNYGKRLKNAN